MARVLLLNPPGTKNYIRDYFCSKLSKANYISPPVVLLTLSGLLAPGHDVRVLDSIVEKHSAQEGLQRICAHRPDVIIALVGAASWEEDRAFLAEVKARCGAYIIAVGDLLLEDTALRLQEAPDIDAALLNFVSPDVLTLIENRQDQVIPNVVYRRSGDGQLICGALVKQRGEFDAGCPRHDLFPLHKYRFPFMVARPMTAILTDYGCPFTCTFCVIPALGFGLRPLESVFRELAGIKQQKVKEIFFLDQTFGVNQERTLKLCGHMISQAYGFHWSCFSRADVLNEPVLEKMAKAGCHTIIFGVESGSDETLTQYQKKMQISEIRRTLQACRRAGIRAAATFMLGLPGESEKEARKTIALALELPLDYVAFNVAIPRAATKMRSESIAKGLIDASVHTMDQSGIDGAVGTDQLSAEKILALRREAVRCFYLRPMYILHRLFTLRSWTDLRTQLADGWGVILDALNGKNKIDA